MSDFLDHLPTLTLSRQTTHRLRKGQGRLAVLRVALQAAGYELRPDPTTLARKAGQRALARRAGLARTTVAALANGQGTLQSYTRLAVTLKAAPRIVRRKSYAACHSSKNQTWQTPAPLLAAILEAAGRDEFDLDPCSPSPGGPVPALAHWTEADDGLTRPWHGLVFVNPPYSRALPKWVAKCSGEADQGTTVVGLVPSRTDTRWWHSHVVGQADVIMLKGRLKFGGGQHSAPFPSAIVVWGDSQLTEQVAAAVPGSWLILAKIAV